MLHSMGYCDFSLYQNKHYDNLVVLRPSNRPLIYRMLFCCLALLPNNNCDAHTLQYLLGWSMLLQGEKGSKSQAPRLTVLTAKSSFSTSCR